MSSQVRNGLLLLLILSAASVFSYRYFSSFNPKGLIPISETHSSENSPSAGIPYPENHEILGTSSTEASELHTFKTSDSPEFVQTFYKNVFLTEDWEIESEGQAGIFLNTEYKKGGDRIKVTSSKQPELEQTIVSVEKYRVD